MGKKKTKAKSASNNTVIVVPFTPQQDEYYKILGEFRQMPTLPILFSLLNTAIDTGMRLQPIVEELKHLAGISSDQFYGAYGSRYFLEHDSELDKYREYRTEFHGVAGAADRLWKVLGKIEYGYIYQHNNYLIGDIDCFDLEAEEDKPIGNNLNTALDEAPILTETTRNAVVDAIRSQADSSEKLSVVMRTIGLSDIPRAAWAYELLPKRDKLKNGLNDFSKYLGSYFAARNDIDIPNLGFSAKRFALSTEDSLALGKIASFLLFEPLVHKTVYGSDESDLSTFYEDRISYLSSLEDITESVVQAEYVIGISNLILMCGKLGLNSVKTGLITKNELKRDYFDGLSESNLISACLACIPPAGFSQVLDRYNPFDSDYEHLDIYNLLKVAGYGTPKHCSQDDLDDLFNATYAGLNPELASEIRALTHLPIMRLVIPLCLVGTLPHAFDGFLEEDFIVREISKSLHRSDVTPSQACLFDREDISDIAMQQDYLSASLHPALFARKFSNSHDCYDFDDTSWMNFAHSLINCGQSRYASLLLALFISEKTVKQSYSPIRRDLFDVQKLVKLFNSLSALESFDITRQAISDYFEMTGDDSPKLLGSFFDFLPKKNRQLADVIYLKEARKTLEFDYRKSMFDSGLHFEQLNQNAQNYLTKGHMLAHSKELSEFGLKHEALSNYFYAVENELRERIPTLNEVLSEELVALGIDIKMTSRKDDRPGKIGTLKGLGGIGRLLNVFNRLSESSKTKLTRLRPIFHHENRNTFINQLTEITAMRNTLQHPEDIKDEILDRFMIRSEDILFGSGKLIQILNETA